MAGKIITIAQQKGGSGKTTLAAHLAIAANRKNFSIAILDIDPQGSLGEWFELRETAMPERAEELSFRTASGWGARREARNFARDHDIVIVDTPPKSDFDGKPAVEAADLVVIPVQPSPVDIWATEPTVRLAKAERTPSLLVFNRVLARARLTGEMEETISDLGTTLASNRLGNRVAFAASMGQGSTVIESEASSKSADEVRALTEEILKAVGR